MLLLFSLFTKQMTRLTNPSCFQLELYVLETRACKSEAVETIEFNKVKTGGRFSGLL